MKKKEQKRNKKRKVVAAFSWLFNIMKKFRMNY